VAAAIVSLSPSPVSGVIEVSVPGATVAAAAAGVP
jgi:hypothetical protein